jgi:putative FmdB family regulatory protein
MPIYEYACTACGERTEAKQTFDDPPLLECPACGGKLRKLYSPVGVVFKGTGFYSTDGRRSPATKSSKESPGSSDKTGSDKTGSDKTGSDKASSDKAKSGSKSEKKASSDG